MYILNFASFHWSLNYHVLRNTKSLWNSFKIYDIGAISLQYELSGVLEFPRKWKNALAHNSQGFSDKNC